MTRELLSSWVTFPVWRDITLLNRLERGEEGERKGEKREIEERRGKKEDLRKKEWGSMKGKV